MQQTKTLKTLLILAGLVGLVVGTGMLFFPVAFHATSGIELDGGVNLLNEMRAAGGVLFVGGGLIMAGAFVSRLTFASTLIATAIYLSYGLSRLVSIGLDGVPDVALVQIAAFEIVVGLLCAAAMFVYGKDQRVGIVTS